MGDFDRNLLVGGSTEFFTNILTRLSGVLASVLLFFVLFFAILPDFHGVSSWLSMASVLGLIGGSLRSCLWGNVV